MDEAVMACDLTALPVGGRDRLQQLIDEVLSSADDVSTGDDRLELRFDDPSPAVIEGLAEFVALDRLCCPFMGHGLIHEPNDPRIWLRLTGVPDPEELVRLQRS